MDAVDCRSCCLGEGPSLGGDADDDVMGRTFVDGGPAERLRLTCRGGVERRVLPFVTVAVTVTDRCLDSSACLRRWDCRSTSPVGCDGIVGGARR